jgi:curved DNA-binding protein CbpA
MQDHYAVLGVSKNADLKVIKAAYRALAKKYHPDTSGRSTERFLEVSRARFLEVSRAWEVLSNPARRQAYDQMTGAGAPEAIRDPAPERDSQPSLRVDLFALFGVVMVLSIGWWLALDHR